MTAPRAMILAAGFGTRLESLTKLRPKPMLPVAGAPLVKWAVLWLRHHGVREVVVNLHHLGEQIEAELGDGSGLGVRIAYSREHGQILGTGGGLRQARPLLDDGTDTPVVVVNGKIMVDLDLDAVLAQHRSLDAEATMVLRPDPEAARWGSLQLDEQGRVCRLLQATPAGRSPGQALAASPPLMFTGVHVVQPRFFDRIPPQGEQCVIRTAYRSLFDEYEALYGHVTDAYWWEHSTPERYRQGVFNLLEGRFDPGYATSFVRGVDPEAHVDPSAEIVSPVRIAAGARIGPGARVGPFVQLDAGVSVRPGVAVERTVAWDGAVIDRDTRDQVVTAPES